MEDRPNNKRFIFVILVLFLCGCTVGDYRFTAFYIPPDKVDNALNLEMEQEP